MGKPFYYFSKEINSWWISPWQRFLVCLLKCWWPLDFN